MFFMILLTFMYLQLRHKSYNSALFSVKLLSHIVTFYHAHQYIYIICVHLLYSNIQYICFWLRLQYNTLLKSYRYWSFFFIKTKIFSEK